MPFPANTFARIILKARMAFHYKLCADLSTYERRICFDKEDISDSAPRAFNNIFPFLKYTVGTSCGM